MHDIFETLIIHLVYQFAASLPKLLLISFLHAFFFSLFCPLFFLYLQVTGNGHMPLQRQVPLRSSLRRKGSLSPSSKRVHFDAPREKTNSDSASSPSEDVVTVSANKMNTIKNMRKKGTGTDSCK